MASLSQKVALSTVAQVVGRVAQMFIGLATITILTRHFGISDYGNYAIIFVYAGFAAVFADFGSTQLIVREATQEKAPLEQLLGSGFVVNVLVGTVVMAAFSLLLLLMPYSPQVKLGSIIALLAVFIGNLNIYGSYYTYRIRQEMMVIIETLGRVVGLGLIIWLVSHNAPFIWIVAATPISIAFNATLGTLLVLKDKIRPKFNWPLAKYIFIHSIPLGIVGVLGLIHFKVDSLILSVFKSSTDVAIYSVAYKVVDLLVVVPSFFMSAAYPALSAAYHKQSAFAEKAHLAFDFILIAGLPTLVGSFLLAPQMVRLLGSAKYLAAALPLQILVFAVFFSYLTIYHSILAIIGGLQRKLIWISATAVVVNIVVNLTLIPLFSYRGAAVTTIISEGLSALLIMRLVDSHMPLRRLSMRIVRIALALVVMAGVIMLGSSLNVLVLVPLAGAVYGICLLLFKAISLKELRAFLPGSSA